jgi:hypothetical protein
MDKESSIARVALNGSAPAGALGSKHTSSFQWYLAIVALVAVLVGALVFAVGQALFGRAAGSDHFAAIPLNGDYAWYLDLSGRHVPEIQDEDLFYHGVGRSIEAAKMADIVLLGPSFVAYALDPKLLNEFGARHGLKIYDMSFIGIRSGEFSRLVIKRWKLHPKLWIINVDDQFEHFFSPSLALSIGRLTSPIAAVKYGQLHGWFAVAGRNVRWRMENLWAGWSTGQPLGLLGIYRRPDDGSVYLAANPRYYATDNGVVKVDRDQNCHTNISTIDAGRDYLRDIGGRAVFMLVPHSQYCPEQARELGKALGVESLLAPSAAFSTVDGGGHLDHQGAVAFTQFLLSALERSETFRRTFPAGAGSGS